MFTGLAHLGLPHILSREIIKTPHNAESLLGSSFFLMIGGALTASLLSLFFVYFIRYGDSFTLLLVGILCAKYFLNSFQVIAHFFDARLESKYKVIASNIAYIISSLLKVLAIIYKADLQIFVVIIVAESFILALVLIYFYQNKIASFFKWKIRKDYLQQLLKDSYPIILSTLAISMYVNLDKIMMRDLVDDRSAGIYAVAIRLTELWYFIPIIIRTSFYPGIIQAKESDEKLLEKKMYQLYSVMVVISLFIALPICIFSDFIVLTLYGAEYQDAVLLLRMLIWALLFVSLGTARDAYLLGMNYSKLIFQTTLLGLIINVIGNLILIPILGALGAVLVTIGSHSISAYFSCFFFKKLQSTGLTMTKVLFKPKLF